MPIKPVPHDANSWKMEDRGTQAMGDVQTIGSSFVPIRFGRDIKGLIFYVVSGEVSYLGVEPASYISLDASAVVDAGGGEVTIAATAHGLTAADTVEIYGTTNYDTGTTDVEAAQTPVTIESVTTDTFNITATYVAETPSGAYAVGYRDPVIPAGAALSVPVVEGTVGTIICYLKAATSAVVNFYPWR